MKRPTLRRSTLIVEFKCNWVFIQAKSSSSTSSQVSTSEPTPSTSASAKAPHQQPQTLEELLERQWEQGSQFLMEQASHFDSKLSLPQYCKIICAFLWYV